MGVEESATQVANKTIDALGTNPLMLGMLLLMASFLGFSAYQQHDGAESNRQMLVKILELRHTEIMEVFERCTPASPTAVTQTLPQLNTQSNPGTMNREPYNVK